MSVRLFGVLAISSAVVALSTACGGSESITVYAASSLAEAFAEIAEEFESQNPGLSVKLNLAGSQRLRSQLELGARADVFASADNVQMDRAVAADLIEGTPATFASSRLAVIVSGAGTVRNLEDLAAPGVSLVLAHPSVPAGAYARQLLENLSAESSGLGEDFSLSVLENVVSEETNVRSVEQKVILGEADAGIVYRPRAEKAVASASRNVELIPIPEDYDVHAAYPIAVLRDSKRQELARRFVALVLSPRGQVILSKHGFDPHR